LICIKHPHHAAGRIAALQPNRSSVGGERAMAVQFLLGTFISVINIMIHALVTVAAIDIARRAGLKHTVWPRSHLMAVMVMTAVILMVAHTVEVLVWALAYALVGAAPEGSELLYFTFVNYTTLGYGDITPVQGWRLTGPITAMNGILMFGWSTAVLFEVLRKTVEHLASISSLRVNSGDQGRRVDVDRAV
jgi:Ion channel